MSGFVRYCPVPALAGAAVIPLYPHESRKCKGVRQMPKTARFKGDSQMKKTLLLAMTALAAVLLFVPRNCFADSVLSVVGPATVSPGDTFVVDVNVTGTADLYAFQLDLAFDPTVLEATGVSEGAFLPGGGTTFFLPGSIDNTGGTVSFNSDTLLSAISGVSGDGTLLVFDFTALGSGTSPLTIENEILLDSGLNFISDTTEGGSVTVQGQTGGGGGGTNVPEPSSLLLLALGVAAVGFFSAVRRRSSGAPA